VPLSPSTPQSHSRPPCLTLECEATRAARGPATPLVAMTLRDALGPQKASTLS